MTIPLKNGVTVIGQP